MVLCEISEFIGNLIVTTMGTVAGTIFGGWVVLRYADKKQKQGEITIRKNDPFIQISSSDRTIRFSIDIFNTSIETKIMRQIRLVFSDQIQTIKKVQIVTNDKFSLLSSLDVPSRLLITKNCITYPDLERIDNLNLSVSYVDENDNEQVKLIQPIHTENNNLTLTID